eukprot:CAMPEP_0170921910 /NCGR_PEP_ID=MMETSP0735-20130129/10109_1 /TAXON_ID=186038 /ORGANISM="Fragilariopsis kerguelensis, Strain L26-C5" /LENGTH=128 /DNA_ID=CAMNT_0011321169 /DNA_START=268 /DNA_END=651 /DNA_ORIENTATION=-
MKEFMDHIKDKNNIINVVNNKHLTSCTFSSAWNDVPDADCVLTLNYGHPLEGDKIEWKKEAQILCRKLRLRQINGRSKGTLLSVKKGGGNNEYDDEMETTIRDTVYLIRSDYSSDYDNNNDDDDGETP